MIFVTATGKEAILAHFEPDPDLEAHLESTGKLDLLDEVRRVSRLAKFIAVNQGRPLGLGHAVNSAAAHTGDEDFAVLLGDDIIDSQRPAIGQLMEVHEERGGSVVALLDVPREHTDRYGICAGEMIAEGLMNVREMVEKPAPAEAPSTYSIVGRYVLPAEIHRILQETPRGAGGEIQLTDALAVLAGEGRVCGLEFEGQRFDTGSVLGLLRASIHYALKRPDLAEGMRDILARYGG